MLINNLLKTGSKLANAFWTAAKNNVQAASRFVLKLCKLLWAALKWLKSKTIICITWFRDLVITCYSGSRTFILTNFFRSLNFIFIARKILITILFFCSPGILVWLYGSFWSKMIVAVCYLAFLWQVRNLLKDGKVKNDDEARVDGWDSWAAKGWVKRLYDFSLGLGFSFALAASPLGNWVLDGYTSFRASSAEKLTPSQARPPEAKTSSPSSVNSSRSSINPVKETAIPSRGTWLSGEWGMNGNCNAKVKINVAEREIQWQTDTSTVTEQIRAAANNRIVGEFSTFTLFRSGNVNWKLNQEGEEMRVDLTKC